MYRQLVLHYTPGIGENLFHVISQMFEESGKVLMKWARRQRVAYVKYVRKPHYVVHIVLSNISGNPPLILCCGRCIGWIHMQLAFSNFLVWSFEISLWNVIHFQLIWVRFSCTNVFRHSYYPIPISLVPSPHERRKTWPGVYCLCMPYFGVLCTIIYKVLIFLCSYWALPSWSLVSCTASMVGSSDVSDLSAMCR